MIFRVYCFSFYVAYIVLVVDLMSINDISKSERTTLNHENLTQVNCIATIILHDMALSVGARLFLLVRKRARIIHSETKFTNFF